MHDIRYRFEDAAAFYGDPDNETPLRGAVPGAAIAIDARRSDWLSDDGVRHESLTPLEAAALAACDVFQRPSAQADDVAARLGLARDDAARVLDALAARGLLASPVAMLGAAVARDRTPLPAPVIAIRATRHPERLARLLDSLLADERERGAARRYLVCDVAADSDARAENLAATRRFAQASTSRVHYLGAHARAQLLRGWQSGWDERARIALGALLDADAPRAACAMNWALLASAGNPLAVLDEEHCFPVREPVGAQSRLELWDSPEVETRFLDDASGWHDRPVTASDPFAAASRWLGQPVRAVVATDDPRFLELENAPVTEVTRAAARARVVAVVAGTWGTLPAHAWEFATTRSTLRDLWRAPWNESRFAGHDAWHGVLAPRLLYSFAGVPLSLDGRDLLPYAGAAHARSFATLLAASVAGGACIWLPLLLGRWADAANTDGAAVLDPDRWLAADDAGALLAALGARLCAGDRAARLRNLGVLCAELAAADDTTLARRAQVEAAPRLLDYARRLDVALARVDAQPAWQAAARAALRRTHERLLAPAAVASAPALRRSLVQVATTADAWVAAWLHCRDRSPLAQIEPLQP